MPLFKFLGLVFLFLASFFMGWHKAALLKRRTRALYIMSVALKNFAETIRVEHSELKVLYPKFFNFEGARCEGDILTFSEDFFEKEDINSFSEFFSLCGMSDRKTEYEKALSFASNVERRYLQAEKNCRENSKMYVSIGLLGGAGVCIFFL